MTESLVYLSQLLFKFILVTLPRFLLLDAFFISNFKCSLGFHCAVVLDRVRRFSVIFWDKAHSIEIYLEANI